MEGQLASSLPVDFYSSREGKKVEAVKQITKKRKGVKFVDRRSSVDGRVMGEGNGRMRSPKNKRKRGADSDDTADDDVGGGGPRNSLLGDTIAENRITTQADLNYTPGGDVEVEKPAFSGNGYAALPAITSSGTAIYTVEGAKKRRGEEPAASSGKGFGKGVRGFFNKLTGKGNKEAAPNQLAPL